MNAADAGLCSNGCLPGHQRSKYGIGESNGDRGAASHKQGVLVRVNDVSFSLLNLTLMIGVGAPHIKTGQHQQAGSLQLDLRLSNHFASAGDIQIVGACHAEGSRQVDRHDALLVWPEGRAGGW